MPQIRLTVQTLTPLLMYGADNKDDRINRSLKAVPELRASSIRGILRYWLRAVVGGRTQDTSKVYEAESDILGSTAAGSKIKVRVQASRSMQAQKGQFVMPHQTKGFSLEHTAFEADEEFRITLSTHPLYKGDIFDADSELIKAVFLMTHFGGLGRRARRGSGNLRVLEARGYEGELPLDYLAGNRDELRGYLSEIAEYINNNKVNKTPEKVKAPEFATFAPDTAVVLLSQKIHPNYQDAFDELWSVSGPYHSEGGIFGEVTPRRASAIHMRVALTREGYVAQQTILYSGRGQWGRMQKYLEHCQTNDFGVIYGAGKSWK